MLFPQGWPLRHRFLHAVLPKDPLAGGNQRFDPFGRMSLGNGNEFDGGRFAARQLCRIGDARENVLKCRGWLIHGALL